MPYHVDPVDLIRRALGRSLAELRREAGLSQRQLASVVGYSRTQIAGAEIGVQRTARDFWERCDRALDARGTLADGYERLADARRTHQDATAVQAARKRGVPSFLRFSGNDGTGRPNLAKRADLRAERGTLGTLLDQWRQDMERRDFLRYTGMSGAALGGLGVTGAHLAHAGKADAATLDLVEASIANCRRLDDRFGARHALGPTLHQLHAVSRLAPTAQSEDAGRRVSRAAGELSQLAGWLSFDLNDPAEARRYFDMALRAAQEANDDALGAYVLGYLSIMATYTDQPLEGIAFAAAAQRQAEGKTTPRTRAWLSLVESEALAANGDSNRALSGLESAQEAMSQSGKEEDPAWMYHLDRAEFDGDHANCLLRLGRHEAARTLLQNTLEALEPTFVRERSLYLARLAETYIYGEDLDEACRLAGEALVIGRETASDRGVARVLELRSQLAPWQTSATVRELDDRLRSLA